MANQNKLLNLVEGCIGLKTGYTKAAGRTLVSCVERDGHRLICVTLHDSNDWADHQALYEYGFNLLQQRKAAEPEPEPAPEPVRTTRLITDAGDYCGEAPVVDGAYSSVPLMAAEAFLCALAPEDLLESRTELSGPLAAPVLAGDKAGVVIYTLNGVEVGRIDLLCSETIPPKAVTGRNSVRPRSYV